MAKLTDMPNEVLDNMLGSVLHGKQMVRCTSQSTTHFRLCDLLTISKYLLSARQVVDIMLRVCTILIEDDNYIDCDSVPPRIAGTLQPAQADLVQRLHIQHVGVRHWFLAEKYFHNVREIVIDISMPMRLYFTPCMALATYIQDAFRRNIRNITEECEGYRKVSRMEIDTTLEDLSGRPNLTQPPASTHRELCEGVRSALQWDYSFGDPLVFEGIIEQKIISHVYHSNDILVSLMQKFVGSGINIVLRSWISLSHSWPQNPDEDVRRNDINFGTIKCLVRMSDFYSHIDTDSL